ncbi:unnamed protein product [Notodromas monacha]|uniref:SET domain-containing protein n=1 Tax=Notodromas monacha TaxID=399045 RepID=A0A7R9GES5_9CRUS|nr:unnamed protein product [Notodromas monacha]CAG0919945.1 unnamed protein product [Notodromas monacha]
MACAYDPRSTGDAPSFSIVNISSEKGRGMVAARSLKAEETVLVESPLVSSQFAWNKSCNYPACDHCLRSLETVAENVARLTKTNSHILPFSEVQDKFCCSKVPCSNSCDVLYCSDACRQIAWNLYHRLLCRGDAFGDYVHPSALLLEAWKSMHYPPETTTIELLSRLVARVRCCESLDKGLEPFQAMCSDIRGEASNDLALKLLGTEFKDRINVLFSLFSQAYEGEDLKEQIFTKEGFTSLLALIARNGQGIGTSPWADYVREVEKLKPLEDPSSQDSKNLDQIIDAVYADMSDKTGLEFINVEGSGLYEIHSRINHSCEPNAEVRFQLGCHTLTVVTLSDIRQGDEICISYLDECLLARSRHSRQKVMKDDYGFVCHCSRCIREKDDPDVTSEDEDEDEMDTE